MTANNLRAFRLARNYTQKELAALSAVSPSSIARYERGAPVPDAVLIRIAAALGVRPVQLVALPWEELCPN